MLLHSMLYFSHAANDSWVGDNSSVAYFDANSDGIEWVKYRVIA